MKYLLPLFAALMLFTYPACTSNDEDFQMEMEMEMEEEMELDLLSDPEAGPLFSYREHTVAERPNDDRVNITVSFDSEFDRLTPMQRDTIVGVDVQVRGERTPRRLQVGDISFLQLNIAPGAELCYKLYFRFVDDRSRGTDICFRV